MTSQRYWNLIAAAGFLLSFIYYALKIHYGLIYWNLHLIGFILMVVGIGGILIAMRNNQSKK